MINQLTTKSQDTDLSQPLTIGEIANHVAARSAFADYRSRKATNTIRRQDNDLALFAQYLADVKAKPDGTLFTEPEAWAGITWGLVEAFVKWQLNNGFAVSSVNVQLSTIKTYAKLAVKAGTIDKPEYAMICTVSGYSHKEAKNIDKARQAAEVPTRIDRPGAKKVEPVAIDRGQAADLKGDFCHGDNPQGRRDRLMMCLLLDHGLRCSEVEILQVSDFDLQAGNFTFYRPKVDKVETHKMTGDTRQAAHLYLTLDALAIGPLLRSSRKGRNGDNLRHAGMSTRAITKRVKVLGEMVGVEGLSAHDCRHYLATKLGREKTTKDLMEIFGWTSPAMAVKYQRDSAVIEVE